MSTTSVTPVSRQDTRVASWRALARLTLLGSDPSRAGQGIGVPLLRHTLGLIDTADAPAYLEASMSLVPMYERYGFNVVGVFVLPSGQPSTRCGGGLSATEPTFPKPYGHGRCPSGE